MAETTTSPRPAPHVALLADPGTGHLIPVATLANHLHTAHHLAVTLITQPTAHSPQSHHCILDALPNEINTVSLPQVPTDIIPHDALPHTASLICTTHNIPHLCDVLRSLATAHPNVILIVDIFGMAAIDAVAELSIPTYLFFTTNCLVLSLGYALLRMELTMEGEFRDMEEPIMLPGCVPICGKDLPEPWQGRGSKYYKGFLQLVELFYKPKGILINSFEALEPGAVESLRRDKTLPPVYPVGPLVRPGSLPAENAPESRPGCLNWLDAQSRGSVIYVSFGSGGTLSSAQMEELALGLEMSGVRFLWVVKRPNQSQASADYFGPNGEEVESDPGDFLPEGFMERTEGKGFVVPGWAPQTEVLSHAATGGFLTHCGWNSVLESIVTAVPVIAWPLYAEQKVNAVMMAEDLGVGVRVVTGEDGVVAREEIARLVQSESVVGGEEGKRLGMKMADMKAAAAAALGEGGSSYRALIGIVREWSTRVNVI